VGTIFLDLMVDWVHQTVTSRKGGVEGRGGDGEILLWGAKILHAAARDFWNLGKKGMKKGIRGGPEKPVPQWGGGPNAPKRQRSKGSGHGPKV